MAAKKTAPKKAAAQDPELFARLRAMLAQHAKGLDVTIDVADKFHVFSPRPHQGKPLFFAGVQRMKTRTSFYLFSIYMFPELVDELPGALRKHLSGKSCFHFTGLDETVVKDLALAVKRGLDVFREKGLV
jgi:hypothetical protein